MQLTQLKKRQQPRQHCCRHDELQSLQTDAIMSEVYLYLSRGVSAVHQHVVPAVQGRRATKHYRGALHGPQHRWVRERWRPLTAVNDQRLHQPGAGEFILLCGACCAVSRCAELRFQAVCSMSSCTACPRSTILSFLLHIRATSAAGSSARGMVLLLTSPILVSPVAAVGGGHQVRQQAALPDPQGCQRRADTGADTSLPDLNPSLAITVGLSLAKGPEWRIEACDQLTSMGSSPGLLLCIERFVSLVADESGASGRRGA